MKSTRDSTKYQLTESNLERHGQLLQRHELNTRTVPWVDKVIKDEQVHHFYSQCGQQVPKDAFRDVDRLATTKVSTSDSSIASLKIFEPQQEMCLEGPLERFLTPDGCSGPSYYTRPALEGMGLSFGSMDGKEERKQIAQQRADVVVKRKIREDSRERW